MLKHSSDRSHVQTKQLPVELEPIVKSALIIRLHIKRLDFAQENLPNIGKCQENLENLNNVSESTRHFS